MPSTFQLLYLDTLFFSIENQLREGFLKNKPLFEVTEPVRCFGCSTFGSCDVGRKMLTVVFKLTEINYNFQFFVQNVRFLCRHNCHINGRSHMTYHISVKILSSLHPHVKQQ